jgi:hypothetical protein
MRTNNPKLFREMNEPYANATEAQSSMDAFAEGVKKLREEHKVTNVLVVVNYNIVHEDSEEGEGEYFGTLSFGNSLQMLPMAAYAYGHQREAQNEAIAKLLKGRR